MNTPNRFYIQADKASATVTSVTPLRATSMEPAALGLSVVEGSDNSFRDGAGDRPMFGSGIPSESCLPWNIRHVILLVGADRCPDFSPSPPRSDRSHRSPPRAGVLHGRNSGRSVPTMLELCEHASEPPHALLELAKEHLPFHSSSHSSIQNCFHVREKSNPRTIRRGDGGNHIPFVIKHLQRYCTDSVSPCGGFSPIAGSRSPRSPVS